MGSKLAVFLANIWLRQFEPFLGGRNDHCELGPKTLPPPQAESTSPTEGILTEQNEVVNQVAHERSTSPMEDIQTDRDDARK